MGITESIQYHESKLELKYGVGGAELANALLNPKYRTVAFWYKKWQTLNPTLHSDAYLHHTCFQPIT